MLHIVFEKYESVIDFRGLYVLSILKSIEKG